jgi:molybdate transport system regulatory protein
MNRLYGTVKGLETEGDISLVEVDVPGACITALVLETPSSAAYLAPGKPVTVLFKESEVSLAAGPLPPISIRNRIACEVVSVETGGLLAHATLSFGDARLHALVSARAARELELRPGAPVHALIKATEVGLAEGHVPG